MKTRKRRIAFLVHSAYNVKFFLGPLLRHIGSRYDVTLYVGNDAPGLIESMHLPIRVVTVPICREVAPLRDLWTLLVLTIRFLFEKPDLVHTMTPKAGLLGTLAASFAFVPVRVHTFQGEVWVHYSGLKRRFFRLLDWLVARLATRTTIVSHSERDFLEKEGVVRAGDGVVLGSGSICGVDVSRFAPSTEKSGSAREQLGIGPDEFVFLYLGRLHRDKGVRLLTDAFKQLPTTIQGQGVRLLVVGPDEGGFRYEMQSSLGERVVVEPYTEHPETYLAIADVLVLPSLREGFGMVLIEAACMEVPTIASRIYGIECAVLEGETGLLFESGNCNDLTDKMRSLIERPALCAELGKKGRLRVLEEFDQQKMLTLYQDFYVQSLKKQKSVTGKAIGHNG